MKVNRLKPTVLPDVYVIRVDIPKFAEPDGQRSFNDPKQQPFAPIPWVSPMRLI